MKLLIATAVVFAGLAVSAAGVASAATPYDCEVYAQQYAEQQYPTGGGALAGGVVGGIAGAIIGSTGGKAGTGAAIGAGAGLVVGSVAWQNAKKNAHDLAYSQCISSVSAPQPAYVAPPVYPTGSFNAVITGTTALNVRQGPGTQYNVVNQIGTGQVFSVYACSGGWCQIPLPTPAGYQQQVGYVSQNYVLPVNG